MVFSPSCAHRGRFFNFLTPLPFFSLSLSLRTPLHIAAAEGNLAAVEALVGAGAAVGAKDRWDHTPLDEARREKRGPVVDFLTRQVSGGGSGSGRR